MVLGTQVVYALVTMCGTVEVIGGGGGAALDVLGAAELVGTTTLVLCTGTVVFELTTTVDVLGAAELDGAGVTVEVDGGGATELTALLLLDVYGQLVTSGPQLKIVCSCVTNAVEVGGSAPALLVVAGADDTAVLLAGGGPYPIGVMAGLAMTAPARATRVRA